MGEIGHDMWGKWDGRAVQRSLSDLRAFVSFPDRRVRRQPAGSYVLDWLTDVLHPVAHAARQPDYSFSDLISLFVVRELLSRGVRPRTIAEAESVAPRAMGYGPAVCERADRDR